MNFSQLVEAIEQNNQPKVNKLIKKLNPRLIRFLQIHMNASREDAEDCAQDALLKALEVIEKGNLRKAKSILPFLLTTCRNNYLNLRKKQSNNSSFDDFENVASRQPRQLQTVLSKERREVLEDCIEQLSDSYRKFFEFWYRHPHSEAKVAAARFNISLSNVWTRKHRVLKKLRECYQKKSNI